MREGTFFESLRLPFNTIMSIFYKYLKGEDFSNIGYDLEISAVTAGIYATIVRDFICFSFLEEGEKIGGYNEDGSSKIVEMDESLFFKRKYGRGRIPDQEWVVGGFERGSKKCFMVPVLGRSARHITQVILDNVLPGTIIMTDEWRAYGAALRDFPEYEHLTINHSLFFVDPLDPVIHTQHIEGLWSLSKHFLRCRRGMSSDQKTTYLIQFLWQFRYDKHRRLNELLIHMDYSIN